jgi:hypothetical protein
MEWMMMQITGAAGRRDDRTLISAALTQRGMGKVGHAGHQRPKSGTLRGGERHRGARELGCDSVVFIVGLHVRRV